jgi:hypothetical protein
MREPDEVRIGLRRMTDNAAESILTSFAAALLVALISFVRSPTDYRLSALRTLLLSIVLLPIASLLTLGTVRRRWRHDRVSVPIALSATFSIFGLWIALWAAKYEAVSLLSSAGLTILTVFCVIGVAVSIAMAVAIARVRCVRRLGGSRIALAGATALAVLMYWAARNDRATAFFPFQAAQCALELVLFTMAAYIARRIGWLQNKASVAGALLVFACFLVVVSAPQSLLGRTYADVFRGGGTERLVLQALRRAADRDGDGYSARFGGGDCDDNNPRAYPLGPIDCDGIVTSRSPERDAPRTPLRPVRRVLIVTIDALRCDLNGRRICPELDRLSTRASYSGYQQVFMAQTRRSLSALFGGRFMRSMEESQEIGNRLVRIAKQAGFRTKAFYSLSQLDAPSLAGDFDERDRDLVAFKNGRSPFEQVTSPQLTQRILLDIYRHKEDPAPQLLWAHFLDPHEPYISTAADAPVRWFRPDRMEDYEIEVRRTDAAVSELIRNAIVSGYDRDAAIVVTGDHGESFEPDHLGHGLSSSEVEISTPFMAWIFDADGRIQPVGLPKKCFQTDAAALLADVIGARPPPDQARFSLVDGRRGDEQFSTASGHWKYVYHRQARFEELFDLHRDPLETRNLADAEPSVLTQMRTTLGTELSRCSAEVRLNTPIDWK